jgi:hypothetical protein
LVILKELKISQKSRFAGLLRISKRDFNGQLNLFLTSTLVMEPAPPSIYKCPHCEAHYSRENWASGNTFGASLWSDGVMTDGMMGSSYDPAIRCRVCGNLFAANKAWIKNQWPSGSLKEKKFYGSGSISLEDAVQILSNESLLLDLGSRPSLFINHNETGLTEEQKKMQALDWGKYSIRHTIWQKLNDEIREEGYKSLTKEKTLLLHENARALLPLLPMPDLEYDQSPLIWKAELHRNLGQFGKSIQTLQQITERSLLKTKRKMIFLNLMRNRKLVRLWGGGRGWSNRLNLWWSWI